MSLLPPKKISWITLAAFFTFDAFSSYWALKYMGGKEGNPLIAPYVQTNPLLFFPIMVFGFLLAYCIYSILETILYALVMKFRLIHKEIVQRTVLATIIIFYFFTVVLNNSLFLLGFRATWMISTALIMGLSAAIIYGAATLYLLSKEKPRSKAA